jgi:hypothetical protein
MIGAGGLGTSMWLMASAIIISLPGTTDTVQLHGKSAFDRHPES